MASGKKNPSSSARSRPGDDELELNFEDQAAPAAPPQAEAGAAATLPDDLELEDLPPPAPKPQVQADAAAASEISGLDDLDESRSEADQKEPAAPRGRGGLPKSELIRVAVSVAAVLLIAALIFGSLLRSGPEDTSVKSLPAPVLPMEGALIQISEAKAAWRARRPTDKVGSIDAFGGVEGKAEPGILPELKLTLDGSSKDGYLRVLFYTPEGRIAGSSVTVKVAGGKPAAADGLVADGNSVTITCSQGVLDEHSFLTYASTTGPAAVRWRIEIAEAADYAAADKDWKVLGLFDISNVLE